MSILTFDTTDCNGKALTFGITKLPFTKRIIDNNNIKFNPTTYVSLGKKSQFNGSTSFYLNAYCPTIKNITTGKWHFFSNLLTNNGYTIKRFTYDFDTKKIEVLVNNILYSYDYTITDPFPNIAIINFVGGIPTPRIMTTVLTNPVTSIVTEENDDYVYINAYKPKTSTIEIGIATFNTTTEIVINPTSACYRCCEGEDLIVYDRLNNIHGKLITASLSNSRERSNYASAYNAVYGFVQDSDINTAISKARIPINKDLIIYKSAFNTGINDGWKRVGVGVSCTILDNEDCLSVLTPNLPGVVSISIQYNDTRLSKTQLGRLFKVKYSITNSSTTVLNKIYITIGSNNTTLNGLAYTSEVNASVNIEPGEMYESSFILELGDGEEFSPLIQVHCEYVSILMKNTLAFTLNEFEISQINSLKTYPRVENGLNNCESIIDNTNLVTNIAEMYNIARTMRYIEYTNTDPSMGASSNGGWNITSQQTSLITKGDWSANSQGVIYLKNHETTDDLPEGVTSAIDYRTNTSILYYDSRSYLYHRDANNLFINDFVTKFKCKLKFWYRINPRRTPGSFSLLRVGWYFYDYITNIREFTDTDWHLFEGECIVDLNDYQLNFWTMRVIGISWETHDTNITYAGSIADFQYSYEMLEDTWKGNICKIDHENKAISNILTYKHNLLDDNLTRAIKHVNQS